jgi:hypothetical protein
MWLAFYSYSNDKTARLAPSLIPVQLKVITQGLTFGLNLQPEPGRYCSSIPLTLSLLKLVSVQLSAAPFYSSPCFESNHLLVSI